LQRHCSAVGVSGVVGEGYACSMPVIMEPNGELIDLSRGASPSTLEAAEDLLNQMITRATGGDVAPAAFRRVRSAVMADPRAANLAPRCVRICRDPDAVWSYIKSQRDLSTYESRRQHLRGEFEPLLSALERLDSTPLDDLVASGTNALDAESVTAAWSKALERRETDPAGAVTAARTLLESVCKTLLDDMAVAYNDRDDLPALYRRVQKALNLAPSDHTEEQFRAILGACTTVVKELGSLRNRASDSHGAGRVSYKPAARHAALAVNLAGSMALFLVETHAARPKS
jgi:hypothetical protein